MAFQNPTPYINGNPERQDHQGTSGKRQNVQIQVPRYQGNQTPYPYQKPTDHPANFTPRHNGMMQNEPYPGQPRNQTQAGIPPPTQTPAIANGHMYPPAQTAPLKAAHPTIDYQLLLLSLAEDYLAVAHGGGSIAALLQRGDRLDEYYKLLSTGLGCLEAVLKNFRMQPNLEAMTRFRYASILFQETENFTEAEEALSKGITLSDRYRLLDLKYNMQHLLAQVMYATNPRASVKFLDGVIKDVEAYQHVAWVYAFRFLRASLSLQMSLHQETLIAIGHLKVIATLSSGRGDLAVSATASIIEALIHLHQPNSGESIEQAQHALAAARSSQLNPAAQEMPQLAAMTHFVDLCCSLQKNDPLQAIPKMEAMQATLDRRVSDKKWSEDGVCAVPISRESVMTLQGNGSAIGVVRVDSDQNTSLLINWLPREDIYALGYTLSGAVVIHRNAMDGQKSEQYLKEAQRLLEVNRKNETGPFCILASRQLWRRTLLCQVRLQMTFALCARTSWTTAKLELSLLKDSAAELPDESSKELKLFVLYLEGLIAQGTGDLPTALSIFQNPSLALPSPTNPQPVSQTSRDLSILSALNTLFIIRSPTHPKHHLLTPLLSTLEPLCLANPSKPIHAAYYLARATAHPNDATGIVKTKQNLQSALQAAKQCANNQLMCITLNFMSWKFFRGVVAEQAEKSARASQGLAKKGRDPLWICVADGVLADTLEVQGKGEEAEKVRREGWEVAGRLPGVMMREVEGEDDGEGEGEHGGGK